MQIRTVVQDAWSVIDHNISYKHDISVGLKRRINRLAALFELADSEFYLVKKDIDKAEEESLKNGSMKNENNENRILSASSFIELLRTEIYSRADVFSLGMVNSFIEELKIADPNITYASFKKAINDKTENAKGYDKYIQQQNRASGMNPYTMVRHCLYAYDSEKYKDLLRPWQRDNYDKWEISNNPQPNAEE